MDSIGGGGDCHYRPFQIHHWLQGAMGKCKPSLSILSTPLHLRPPVIKHAPNNIISHDKNNKKLFKAHLSFMVITTIQGGISWIVVVKNKTCIASP